MQPLFRSFDEAWEWFAAGGELETAADRRERFTHGRAQFLSFQAPVVAPAVLALVGSVRDALKDVEGIVPQPDEHLHISIRGAGFQVLQKRGADEISRDDAGSLGEGGARAMRGVHPFDVTLGPINVFPDALVLEVHDGGAFAALRALLDEAITTGDTLVDDAHYLPHVTVATFDAAEVSGVLRERVAVLRRMEPVDFTLRRVDFARWWFTGFDERESVELEAVRSYVLR